MVSSKIWDLETLGEDMSVFLSSFHIGAKAKCALWLQLLADDTWVQMNSNEYDLINNSVVTDEDVLYTVYKQVELRVADTEDELTDSVTDIGIVASIHEDITTVAGIESEVVITAGLETEITAIGSDPLYTSLINAQTNADTTDANVILTNADVVTTNADVVLTNADVTSTNADVVLTNADVVSTQILEWEAEAEVLTADSYATETEDVFVKTYASDGDGTFTATDTSEYSALHWAAKAEAITNVSLDSLNDVDTTGKADGDYLRYNDSSGEWEADEIDWDNITTTTPVVTITTSVNEGSTTEGSYTSSSGSTVTITCINGTIQNHNTSAKTFDFVAHDVTDDDNDTDVISASATLAGELRSDVDTTNMTIVYVPIVGDDALSNADFAANEEESEGFGL